jgi:hypothetical protein
MRLNLTIETGVHLSSITGKIFFIRARSFYSVTHGASAGQHAKTFWYRLIPQLGNVRHGDPYQYPCNRLAFERNAGIPQRNALNGVAQ